MWSIDLDVWGKTILLDLVASGITDKRTGEAR